MIRTIFFVLSLLCSGICLGQITIQGKVVDTHQQPIPSASLQVVGQTQGVATDFNGNFSLQLESLPASIRVSSIGFVTQTISFSSAAPLTIVLEEETMSLGEIVVSASRTPERIFESPVTVERFGLKEIKNTASVDFYDGLENLKGVDINTNSLTFKSINTRGFASFANTRFVQLVDGMDNSAPALNFVLGNLLGMTEIDVQSVELLPGASSALYGANAFNGILFMRSKSPFDFEGISAYAKSGLTSQKAAGDNIFWDLGIRAAKKFSDKFAGKVNFSYLEGTDWFAVSQDNVLMPGTGREQNDYDGLNVYGDEVSTNIQAVGLALAQAGIIPSGAVNLLPDENVSRTGYLESDLTDYQAQSIKFDGALHYRPFADDLELIYQVKIGKGATIYQGANRYALKNFFLQQHKVEIKNDNFFLRAYMTDEDAGDSYDMRFTGININRFWKSDQQWFGEYAGAYIQATLAGASNEQAHQLARQTAETGRLIPGTPAFEQALNSVTSNPDLATGSQFRDGSQLYHADGNYNFAHLIDFADIQVGGSYRTYRLNSFGTIFTDYDGPISYSELGLYTQIQKQLMDERLKLTASLRYDKSELFDGQMTPRFSIGYTAGNKRNHNFRASVQSAFRNPTTQDLYIGLDVGRAILVGSSKDNLDRYVRDFPVNNVAANGGNATATISGRAAYENSFSAASVAQGAPVSSEVALVEPEKAMAYEVGYRGHFGKVTVDLNAYYTDYNDFIASQNVISPLYGQVGDNSLSLLALQSGDYKVFQAYTNADSGVQSYGASIAVASKILNGFDISANYTFADFEQDDPEFRASFNTPKHKVKASFGHTELVKNFGFNLSYRWSDSYFWQSSFGDGNIPSISVFDAQLNYTVPKIKSIFKVGAANLSGEEYYTAYGTGLIGTQLYVSWTINNF
ncbi:MAG TPA: TonB-dependent receptor [Galbibacter sp.]|nr:TonB-dependent receptor [Galbibacter sp.]HLV63377.1 TonB-dependent receptor [Galbibacter sp.]